MLRILIVAALLLLVSTTSAGADEMADPGAVAGASAGEVITVQLLAGAGAGAQAFLQPAVRAGAPTAAMQRSLNGVARTRGAAARSDPMLALFVRSEKSGLALPVSDAVSVGLRYQYLRREDLSRAAAADTATMDEDFSSHNLVVRASWQF